ncbi:MAG: hypothetical protein M3340_12090 [Actinomycetota bacterium]|nr:hypothetical protein [Actinomycetota bacterium]
MKAEEIDQERRVIQNDVRWVKRVLAELPSSSEWVEVYQLMADAMTDWLDAARSPGPSGPLPQPSRGSVG